MLEALIIAAGSSYEELRINHKFSKTIVNT